MKEMHFLFLSFLQKFFMGFLLDLRSWRSSKLEKIKTIYFDFSAELHYLFDKKYIILQEKKFFSAYFLADYYYP